MHSFDKITTTLRSASDIEYSQDYIFLRATHKDAWLTSSHIRYAGKIVLGLLSIIGLCIVYCQFVILLDSLLSRTVFELENAETEMVQNFLSIGNFAANLQKV